MRAGVLHARRSDAQALTRGRLTRSQPPGPPFRPRRAARPMRWLTRDLSEKSTPPLWARGRLTSSVAMGVAEPGARRARVDRRTGGASGLVCREADTPSVTAANDCPN